MGRKASSGMRVSLSIRRRNSNRWRLPEARKTWLLSCSDTWKDRNEMIDISPPSLRYASDCNRYKCWRQGVYRRRASIDAGHPSTQGIHRRRASIDMLSMARNIKKYRDASDENMSLLDAASCPAFWLSL